LNSDKRSSLIPSENFQDNHLHKGTGRDWQMTWLPPAYYSVKKAGTWPTGWLGKQH